MFELLFFFIILFYNHFFVFALLFSLFTSFTKTSDLEIHCVVDVRVTYTVRYDTVSASLFKKIYITMINLDTYGCNVQIPELEGFEIFSKIDLGKISLCTSSQGSGAVGGNTIPVILAWYGDTVLLRYRTYYRTITILKLEWFKDLCTSSQGADAVGGIMVPVTLTGYGDTVLIRYRTYCRNVTILKLECFEKIYKIDRCKNSQWTASQGSDAGWWITVRVISTGYGDTILLRYCTYRRIATFLKQECVKIFSKKNNLGKKFKWTKSQGTGVGRWITVRVIRTWYGDAVLLRYITYRLIATFLKLECIKILFKNELGKKFKWTESQGSGAGMWTTVPVLRIGYCDRALKTAISKKIDENIRFNNTFCNVPFCKILCARNPTSKAVSNLEAIDQSTIFRLLMGTVTKITDGTRFSIKYGESVKIFIVSGNRVHRSIFLIKYSRYGGCSSPNYKIRYGKSVSRYGYGGYLSFL